MVSKNNFSLMISNICRGLDGAILDRDIQTPSLCISHGIIARSFNNKDKIYKEFIADGVFSGESNYFSIQSKTMKDSLSTHKISGQPIITGNAVFSKKQKKVSKEYFLYASTLKDFTNFQYYGVETFYEYWNTLKHLNEIANKKSLRIVVKLHPTVKNCSRDIKDFFKHLKFSNEKIENLLSKSIGLISYSSSAIEDALNSEVPVILFDCKKRYKHISTADLKKNNAAVYYVHDKNQLSYILKKLSDMKKINFKDYIFNKNFNDNFKEKILPILKLNEEY